MTSDAVEEFLRNGGKIETIPSEVPKKMALRKKWAQDQGLPTDKESLKRYRAEYEAKYGTRPQRIREAHETRYNGQTDDYERWKIDQKIKEEEAEARNRYETSRPIPNWKK